MEAPFYCGQCYHRHRYRTIVREIPKNLPGTYWQLIESAGCSSPDGTAGATENWTFPGAPVRIELACEPNLAITIPEVAAFEKVVEPESGTPGPSSCV